jgi:hypothetical protein
LPGTGSGFVDGCSHLVEGGSGRDTVVVEIPGAPEAARHANLIKNLSVLDVETLRAMT